MVAPNQPKYKRWYNKWFNTHSDDYCRLDLQTPLAFQQGVVGKPSGVAPHTTSLFFLGLKGPNASVHNHASGYVYPNIDWLRKISFANKINVPDYSFCESRIVKRLQALELAEKFRETNNVPDELLSFVPPPLPKIKVSTTDMHDSIWSSDRRIHLASHFARGSVLSSRQSRKLRRTVRTLGQQLDVFPKLPKGSKHWMQPIPKICSICQKKGHPPNKCTRRILREDECIFSTKYEQWLFRYVTNIHQPYHPVQRPANMGLIPWFEKEMSRISKDALHFRTNFVTWVRKQTKSQDFSWSEHPTFSFSEIANAVDYWAALGTSKYILQRFINGFRVELTNTEVSFEVRNDLPEEKNKELFELHTKPFLEQRKACVVPDWYPQVVLSRFLVEEPTKKRPILDGSPPQKHMNGTCPEVSSLL